MFQYNKANCGKNNLEDHGDFLQMKQKYKVEQRIVSRFTWILKLDLNCHIGTYTVYRHIRV